MIHRFAIDGRRLRPLGERLVLRYLDTFPAATEQEIARMSQRFAAPSTISAGLRRARKEGLIEPAGRGRSPWGRPARLWRLVRKVGTGNAEIAESAEED